MESDNETFDVVPPSYQRRKKFPYTSSFKYILLISILALQITFVVKINQFYNSDIVQEIPDLLSKFSNTFETSINDVQYIINGLNETKTDLKDVIKIASELETCIKRAGLCH